MNRRGFLGGSILAGGAYAVSACTSSVSRLQSTANSKPAMVLVHGAWHGGWCWRDVRNQLRALDYDVYTPTLAGLGERIHLNGLQDVSLETHIQDIVNLISYEELQDIVLVGHSYAGLVISGVADRLVADRLKDKIRHLVYLDAILAGDGGSLMDPLATIPDAVIEQQLAQIPVDDNGMLPVPDLAFLGLDDSFPKAPWLLKHMTPHPVRTLADRLKFENGGPDGIDKTYMLCTKPMLPGKDKSMIKAFTATPDWSYLELATSHDAMVTEPLQLTDLLNKIGMSG